MGTRGSYGENDQIASFDVFDTLVTRVSGGSKTVFSCVERRAISDGLDAKGFAVERAAAEFRALDAVGEANLRLEDIYECLRGTRYYHLRDRLMKMEEDAEVDLCVPIASGVESFYRCLESCDAVVVVSDMYLPELVVTRILDRCGIVGYAKLYVSCVFGETKADGSLYDRVTADLGVRPDQISHYGDNFHSDVFSARKHGLNAVAMVRGQRATDCKALAQKAIDRATSPDSGFLKTITLSVRGGDLIERVGYTVLGPLIVSFCEWLHAQRSSCNLDGLWFAARDGLVAKRCYDLLYPDEQTEYLYVSRRSTTVPMLCENPAISTLAKTLGLGREMCIEEILSRLGFTKIQASNLREEHGFAPGERLVVADLENDKRFLDLYGSVTTSIVENSSKELSAMAAYFRGAFGNARNIGLVDLGWRGSIQHAIDSALPAMGLGNASLRGFYLGVDVDSAWWGKQLMEGFLFSPEVDEAPCVNERWFNALIEAFFIAPHGSVRRYVVRNDGCVSAELEPREGGNEDSSPLFTVQTAALRFARDYRDRRWSVYGILNYEDAIRSLYRLGLEPTVDEASVLGDCVFAYQEVSCLARPKHGAGYYCVHPIELVREIKVCYWKPAFLKRLVPLPIPFWRILAFFKEIEHKN